MDRDRSSDRPRTFGTEGAQWRWQDGGVVEVAQKTVTLALHDLTGFAGRCDALLFTVADGAAPPNELATLAPLRRNGVEVRVTSLDTLIG